MADLSPVLNEAPKDLQGPDALEAGPLLLERHVRGGPAEPGRTLERGRRRGADRACALPKRGTPSDLSPFEPALAGPVDGRGLELEIGRLDRTALEHRRRLLAALGRLLERIGQVAQHPWRGVGRTVLLPADQRRLVERAGALRVGLETLRLAAARVAEELGGDRPDDLTLRDLEPILDTAEFLSLAPDGIDHEALLDPVWQTRRDEIEELMAAGRAREALRAGLEQEVVPAALEGDVRGLAARYDRQAGRWWRLVAPGWWLCRREARRLLRRPWPVSPEARRDLLERLVRLQAAERHLRAAAPLGLSAFGAAWRGLDSDFTALAEIEHWERDGRAPLLLEHAAQRLALLARPERTAQLAIEAQRLLASLRRDLEALFEELGLDRGVAFGVPDVEDLPLVELEDRLDAWSSAGEALRDWVTLRHQVHEAREAGLDPLVAALLDGRIGPRDALRVFDAIVVERLLGGGPCSEPELPWKRSATG